MIPIPSTRRPVSRRTERRTAALLVVLLPVSAVGGQSGGGSADAPAREADETRVEDATEEKQPAMLDEVVITATRRAGRSFDLSFSTHTVTADDIRESSLRTTPEALRELPAVMVQKTSHGQGSPFIRGFTGFHNLFLIDGIRLNNSVFRSGPNEYWNTVDPFSLDRIEVVKGPTSVLYGSDAIGGTVHAITKSPTTYGEGVNFERRLYYRLSSAERSHVARFELDLAIDEDWGVLFGATVKDFGSLQGGRGTSRQPNTGYEEWDADVKVEHSFRPNTRLVIAHQRVSQNNVPRTHRTIFAEPFEGTTVGTDRKHDFDQERELTYVQLHVEKMDSFIEAMRLSVSWQELHETRDRIRSNGRREERGFDAGTLGLTAQFESPSSFGTWTYGFEYYHDHVNSFSTRNPVQGPVADNASYDLFGAYAQDEIALSPRLEATLGGRIQYARADANRVLDPITGRRISVTDDWCDVVGSARLSFEVVPERVMLFGGVSQGFRTPNLSDLTRFDVARTSEVETPSPGLDPEYYISFEAGIKTAYDNWSMQAAYFHTLIDDMIIRVPTGRVLGSGFEVTKINGGDGFVQGIELATSYRVHPQWTVFGDVAWIDGEVDTFPTSFPRRVREPISRLMPVTGRVGVRWDDPSRKVWVEGLAAIADNQDDLNTRDRADTSRIPPGGTPSYTVFSLRGGWQIKENVELTLAVENITDEDYRVHGSGLNEPGRSLNVGVAISF